MKTFKKFLALGVILFAGLITVVSVCAFIFSLFGFDEGTIEWYVPVLLFLIFWVAAFLCSEAISLIEEL